MNWLRRNAEALQAVGALLTAAFAIVALVGVKWQLDTSERIARETQARDIYRSFLALSLAQPNYAEPGQCPGFEGAEATAYDYYMEYTLYTAEQVIEMDPAWEGTFEEVFSQHLDWLCGAEFSGYTEPVERLITQMQARQCAAQFETCG
ncbi:MAG: hypothetical protein AAF092_03255 [Pseudomonadota bacterium]